MFSNYRKENMTQAPRGIQYNKVGVLAGESCSPHLAYKKWLVVARKLRREPTLMIFWSADLNVCQANVQLLGKGTTHLLNNPCDLSCPVLVQWVMNSEHDIAWYLG